MLYGAIDLHTQRSQIRIVDEQGHIVLERRVETSRAMLTRTFDRPPMRILLESGTESEWVAQTLEALGHDVIVADPNYAAMYGQRTRRVKTDRRDVAALADACRRGLYRYAHRVAAATQVRRQQLRVREHLIRTRTHLVNALRAVLRQHGVRIRLGYPETIEARLDQVAIAPTVLAVIAPLRMLLRTVSAEIRVADRWVRTTAAAESVPQRLMTVPGVGPVIALTYHATLDTPQRFGGDAARASAYVGLVPREYSSGEQQRKGPITKAGPPTLRCLLVQAAWTVWRRPGAAGAALHAWARRLAARRGTRIAIVALARRLNRILFAIWRDDTVFTIRAAA